MELNKIYNMDCLEYMKTLPDNSIHCIVTSPPYNLGGDFHTFVDGKRVTYGDYVGFSNGNCYGTRIFKFVTHDAILDRVSQIVWQKWRKI